VNRTASIFIVEDEAKMRDILRINLAGKYRVHLFPDAESALGEFRRRGADLMITDVRLPGMDGMELMGRIREMDDTVPFILFTGYGSIGNAVEAMKKGAFDYLTKPIKIEELEQAIHRALSFIEVSRSSVDLDREYTVTVDDREVEFITRDPATIHTLQLAQKAAGFAAPILIRGETGTGKDLVARLIHTWSGRTGPFVQLNYASIPRDILEGELFGYRKGAFTDAVQDYAGKIALSHQGTLFLDEIGELPLEVQAKLLNVLEQAEFYPIGSNARQKIDLRLVAATNRSLRKMVDEGSFRHDLYYRVAVIPVTLPLLRERTCDILPLAEYFLRQMERECILSPEARLQLLEHGWPGNVRELKNVLERSALLAEGNLIRRVVLELEDMGGCGESSPVPLEGVPGTWQEFKQYKSRRLGEEKGRLERLFVEKLLVRNGGNISGSARTAGMDRRQLQDLIRELGIDPSLFREG
jgi:DNA-binding NtrC family response regulator